MSLVIMRELFRKAWVRWTGVFLLGILIGSLLFGGGDQGAPTPENTGHENAPEKATIWTCSMHPQIQLPEPGKCPICFMDLIPMETGGGHEGPTQLSMSPEAMKLADIATTPVSRQFVEAEVRTVGKVAVDERRLRKITAWMGGRLDRLYVDYTGIPVKKGDHLVKIYSPELYAAQAELIEAIKAKDELRESQVELIRETAHATVEAAREKLRLLGLKEGQIESIEQRGTPDEHITIYSPIEGIVVDKQAMEGDYVKTGSPIYTIAELSHVWVMLDVYESDLSWVRYGQTVNFEVEAFPGESFTGRIAFIDPLVNPRTRTVKVRVNAENPGLRLKPDMFVRAVIRPRMNADGRILDPDLAGKWVSPMHPEIVKDRPGTCDICGMPLVRASELGFVTTTESANAPLVIPASAPLITGKRAVVYVKIPGRERPTFEGREVVLGPRAGGFYLVESGLSEGEEVVVKGNFKIDSAMQIQAKPSMMSPDGGAPAPGHSHGAPTTSPSSGEGGVGEKGSKAVTQGDYEALKKAPEALRSRSAPLFEAYFAWQAALAKDDLEGARRALETVHQTLSAPTTVDLADPVRSQWNTLSTELGQAARHGRRARDLASMREAFDHATSLLVIVERTVGPPAGESHNLMFCPMAFQNRGAYWLQEDAQVRNPYFGASMLKCGEVRETFESR